MKRMKLYKNICSVCKGTYRTFNMKSKIGLCAFCEAEKKVPK